MDKVTASQDVNESDPNRLFELVYTELRRLAAYQMYKERAGHTLTPTALVNEVWLRLGDARMRFEGRAQFVHFATRAMRQVLVDHARGKKSRKRAGEVVPFDLLDIGEECRNVDMLALDMALDRLAEVDSRAAQVVQMRFFGGLAHEEIAAMLGVTRRTVDRDWSIARAWLFGQVKGGTQGDS
ncbi:MAG: sigma-70 family RNA polymerase sigma factor [Bryobacterales bacterium]|nr:sigma-70 family RNA polymerase sigma factor [Bryobacterales bacterium]